MANKWAPRPQAKHKFAGLLDFIPRVSPHFWKPLHLQPLVDLLEAAARGEPVRAVVSTPPQHGKSETLVHALAWMLAKEPRRTHAYTTYGSKLSRSWSRRARARALAAGVDLSDDMANLDEWRTRAGGGLLATGVGGPLTGQGLGDHGGGLLVVDDPCKNRVEAESALIRERTWEWFTDVALTRRPRAIIVNAARWHPDDLPGRLIAKGYTHINLQAIGDDGAPLCSQLQSLAELESIRALVGEYTWASLYQGQPRSRGGAVFRDVTFYESPPTDGYKLGSGVDLAYSAKTHADYSVGVLLAKVGDVIDILDVARAQVEAPAFKRLLRQRWEKYPRLRPRWYAGGPEKGIADLLREGPDGLDIDVHAATADKFVRAQPVAAAWNGGRVRVPRAAPWLDAFVAEVCGFTGVSDAHDDQVDALAAAFDAIDAPPPKPFFLV